VCWIFLWPKYAWKVRERRPRRPTFAPKFRPTVESQKKPGLRSIPYDSINADMSRIAAAEEYVIFLMTSPYEVGKDIAETFIAPPLKLRNQK